MTNSILLAAIAMVVLPSYYNGVAQAEDDVIQ
jgi:hypothetical protein